ncbi:hypothetical protein [Rugamonas rivuli]|uniref:Uncharacterized protein n=1 Tax=Rugamonas rivuli TaxID=2743358 RepID=A0A843SCY0_9BURK|nr:hypothetical protein [Rugamonas rivuli]MQA22099.1 hypothetical protein [Rugamonas rivuli]
MSQRFKNQKTNIHGDGNAVGNSNTVIVNKETHNYHGGPNSEDSGTGHIFSAMFGMIIAIVFFAYWFAKYADIIYTFVLFAAVCGIIISASATLYNVWREYPTHAAQSGLITVIGMILAAAVLLAMPPYPHCQTLNPRGKLPTA